MKKVVVDIFDISYEGAGVGRFDEKVVFVPKTLLKEKVEAVIVKEKSNFSIGELSNIVVPSEKRTVPRCPYFEKCGGCDFQHCDYENEKKIKTQILERELRKIGCETAVDFESGDRFGYRNKLKLEIVDGKVGYYKAKSHEFFEIEECCIATKEINKAIKLVKEFLLNNNLKGVKSVYIKQVEKEIGVCFLFDKEQRFKDKKLKKIEIFEEISLFFAYGDVLESDSVRIYCVKGNKTFQKKVDNVVFQYDISAFNQINDKIAEKMYEFVVDKTKGKRVVNAYSGQGFLTYLISKNANFVYGIEYQKSAHDCAEKLMECLSEYKIENICGKVEDCLEKIILRDNIDVLVLDPAREGCKKEVLDTILKSKVEQIIYISCNFSTLMRDVKLLRNGYSIDTIKIYDMFPCTANMETIVVLKKI